MIVRPPYDRRMPMDRVGMLLTEGIYIYIYVYTYTYIHICIERERERKRDMYVCMYVIR